MALNTAKFLDKLGAIGSFLSAAACPACFPLLAAAGAALGLGVLKPFERYMLHFMQGFVAVAFVGNVMAWRQHRNRFALTLGTVSSAMVFFAIHAVFNPALVYAGLTGLMAAAIWNMILGRRCACAASPTVELKSTITCPKCGFRQEETMPTDACLFFYECPNCKALLKPRKGDCCVFCSYGTIKCPPKQRQTC